MRFGSSAETASVCKSNARACAGPGDFAGGVQKTPVVWRGVSHEAAPSSARLFSCRPPVAPQMVRIPGVNSGASSDRFSVQVSARWRTDSMSRVASVYAAFITFWHIGAQRRRNDLGGLKIVPQGTCGFDSRPPHHRVTRTPRCARFDDPSLTQPALPHCIRLEFLHRRTHTLASPGFAGRLAAATGTLGMVSFSRPTSLRATGSFATAIPITAGASARVISSCGKRRQDAGEGSSAGTGE